jgi:NADH-quinone oxidoreductase subunit N
MLVFDRFLIMAPEIIITIGACFILLIGSFFKKRFYEVNFYTYLAGILCVFFSVGALLWLMSHNSTDYLFRGSFIIDRAALRMKLILLLFTLFGMVYIYKNIVINEIISIEFIALLLFSVVGGLVVISSGDFLVMYLGLELLSLPIYALITLNSNYVSSIEAAFKYFVMGCVSSALLLFGISLLYGLCGSLNMVQAGYYLSEYTNGIYHGIFILCPVMLYIGIAFKFGAAPFHMWVPDVYKGAPISIVLIIGTVPKIAAYGILYRFLTLLFDTGSCLYMSIHMLAFMALLSLFIGNLGALSQVYIKRLLGYSAISHIGFIFFGFVASVDGGDAFVSSFFYIIVYVLSFSGVAACLCVLGSRGNEVESVGDLKGLFYRSPFLSFMFLIFLFSMIGIPPMAGFYAKFFILLQLFYFGMGNIIIVMLLFSVIGSFYYLVIIREIFFTEPDLVVREHTVEIAFLTKVLLIGSSTVIIFLGVFPGYLLNWCTLY